MKIWMFLSTAIVIVQSKNVSTVQTNLKEDYSQSVFHLHLIDQYKKIYHPKNAHDRIVQEILHKGKKMLDEMMTALSGKHCKQLSGNRFHSFI